MVPAVGDFADEVVTVEPMEPVQVETTGRIHIMRRKRFTLDAIEQHHAGPVLFLVAGLWRAQELGIFLGHVVVLHYLHRIVIVAQGPQFGDILKDQHVAIHENGPSLVVAEVGREESRKGEVRRLQRIPLTGDQAFHLGQHDWCDRYGLARACVNALRQYVEGDGLAWIKADKDTNHLNYTPQNSPLHPDTGPTTRTLRSISGAYPPTQYPSYRDNAMLIM